MENPLLQKKNLFQSNTNYNKLVKAVSKETAFFLYVKKENMKKQSFFKCNALFIIILSI